MLNLKRSVVTFENFTINGNKVEGTKTIEKLSDFVYKINLVMVYNIKTITVPVKIYTAYRFPGIWKFHDYCW